MKKLFQALHKFFRPKTMKLWCIRCMCGEQWVMDADTEHKCHCGATLFRESRKCHAEIPDGYDLKSKPFPCPGIFKGKFEIDYSEEK